MMYRDHRWVWIVLGGVGARGAARPAPERRPDVGLWEAGATIHGIGWAREFGMGLAGLAMLGPHGSIRARSPALQW
jgi:hypothetical protein